MNDDTSITLGLDEETRRWQQQFVSRTALTLLVSFLIFIWLPPLFMATYEGVAAIAIGIVVCLFTFLLSKSGRHDAASRSLTYGFSLAAAGAYASGLNTEIAVVCLPIATTVHLFLLSPEKCTPLLVVQVLAVLAAAACRAALSLEPVATIAGEAIAICALIAVQLGVVLSLGRRTKDSHDALREHAEQVALVVAQAKRVAQGDLSVSIDTEGELAEGFRDMVENLRELVRSIVEVSTQVAAASTQILATSQQQEGGAVAQSSAAAEIHETMRALLESSRQIEAQSTSVADNAAQTLQNNELVRERIDVLTAQLLGIERVLEVIKDIAGKSEFLALNAALEGTRAGEAGRGFSLVASQMRRLAERIIGSLSEIAQLAADVREATDASVAATENGMKVAREMASSAQQISYVSRQQRSGTEQASTAMEEIADVARMSVAGTKQVVVATQSLAALVESLEARANRFRLRR